MASRRSPPASRLSPATSRLPLSRCVVLQPQVRDLVLTHQVPQRVLQLRLLNEEIVFRLQTGRGHWTLIVERQPLLDALHSRTLCEVAEEREIEHDRRGKNGVAAKEIDLDLHRVVHPPDNVDVVPA